MRGKLENNRNYMTKKSKLCIQLNQTRYSRCIFKRYIFCNLDNTTSVESKMK